MRGRETDSEREGKKKERHGKTDRHTQTERERDIHAHKNTDRDRQTKGVRLRAAAGNDPAHGSLLIFNYSTHWWHIFNSH